MPQPSPFTVAGLLVARATADPDRATVVFAEGPLSYRELADATRRAAARLVALGRSGWPYPACPEPPARTCG